MTLLIVVLQVLVLVALLVLLFRRQAPVQVAPDARQLQLPEQVTQLAAGQLALDNALRTMLAEQRREQAAEAQMGREAGQRAFSELRVEITGSIAALVRTIQSELAAVRLELGDSHAAAAGKLETNVRLHHDAVHQKLTHTASENRQDQALARETLANSLAALMQTVQQELAAVRQQMGEAHTAAAEKLETKLGLHHDATHQKLTHSASENRLELTTARETMHTLLKELMRENAEHQERLRGTVGDALTVLDTNNRAKLEEMRVTVDEKLNATLHTRLTESFGQVTDQLNKVHSGLGEMSKLSEGVGDLSRIFTNVKTRGGFAEVQLGMLLEQMLAPSQFVRNARVKPNTLEAVEFAVRFPGHSGETLLPIDAKFPREDWERLESAYASNDPDLLAAAGRAFENAIRAEGKRICEKYINPPRTTPHAIMFLPTEGLYAEVMRRDSLQSEIQSKCQVTIAGPSTLSAILTSFQMGFHMLALQEKGDEVWKVLESTKTQFGKFEGLMEKVEGDVLKVQKTLGEVGVRTRAINRSLRDVSDTANEQVKLEMEDLAAPVLQLAAAGDQP